MPKILSECCELVQLCDINCSGPVFETQCCAEAVLTLGSLYCRLGVCLVDIELPSQLLIGFM